MDLTKAKTIIGYKVTGINNNKKRFSFSMTSRLYAMSINVWQGSVWEVHQDGTKKLIKRIYN